MFMLKKNIRKLMQEMKTNAFEALVRRSVKHHKSKDIECICVSTTT